MQRRAVQTERERDRVPRGCAVGPDREGERSAVPGEDPTINPEGGELFLFVLRGDIEIDDGQQERVRIGKGDAVYVRTDRNRTFRNTGGKPAEWVAVQTPPVP